MTVKTIFKVLIGTIFTIIVSCVILELFNVNASATQIKSLCNISTNQALRLFLQETYKSSGGNGRPDSGTNGQSGATNIQDIKTADNVVVVSGKFYNGISAASIWRQLYDNDNFKSVADLSEGESTTLIAKLGCGNKKVEYKLAYMSPSCKNEKEYRLNKAESGKIKTIYSNIAKFYAGRYDRARIDTLADTEVTYEMFMNDVDIVDKKSFAVSALTMADNMYTPSNLGFPYFDPTVLNKIFQWNLAKLLSTNTPDALKKDESGQYYVAYNGFRCYASKAYISNIEYYIYDMNNDSECNKLNQKIAIGKSDLSKLKKENNYATVVRIRYSIPIAYQGITPLKNIIKYAWDSEVDGNKNNTMYNSVETNINRSGAGQMDTSTQSMSNNKGELDSLGEIYFVLIR